MKKSAKKSNKKSSALLGYKTNVPVKKTTNIKSRNDQTANSLYRPIKTGNKGINNTEIKKRNSVSESEQKAQTNRTPLKSRKYSVKDISREEESQIRVKKIIIT